MYYKINVSPKPSLDFDPQICSKKALSNAVAVSSKPAHFCFLSGREKDLQQRVDGSGCPPDTAPLQPQSYKWNILRIPSQQVNKSSLVPLRMCEQI